LLDVILPGIDGFETCRRLKEDEATRHIPVIFITAQTNTMDRVRGFVLGAVDYISRPIQSEEVLARLKTHLTLRELQKDMAAQNARLQEEIAERERLIEELDAFAHTVAHDLKNPLGVTINYAQFVRKYRASLTPEELDNNLGLIIKSGQKMKNIIDELLLLSSIRIEDVTPVPLDMGKLVDEAVQRLDYLIKEYDAQIEIPSGDSWPVVWGYGPWIEEIWLNYLSNAVKYGGRPPQIEVGAIVRSNSMVRFWVKDNGPGISEQSQSKLFVPFNRLNLVHVEGHGLGLSIVQRIVNKLGGRVGIASKPGVGSVFSFDLPQAEPPAESTGA
jgi:signal transduction histidine kinase